MIRVAIVDDYSLIRKGIINTLSTDANIKIVGEAASGKEALSLISLYRPDIVILDMHMSDMTGLQIADWALRKMMNTRIIFHTASENIFLIKQMLLPNVYGILTKNCPGLLLQAVNNAFVGMRYLQPNLAYDLAILIQTISRREFQVAYLLYEGKNISQIAKVLRLSKKTVYGHKINIRKKIHSIKENINFKLNKTSSSSQTLSTF